MTAELSAAGIRDVLVDGGIGSFNTDYDYLDTETGITFKRTINNPDRIIVITPYDIQASPDGLWDEYFWIQLKFRGTGDPFDVDRLAQRAFEALDGLSHLVWSGMQMALCKRMSVGTLGPDENDRWQVTHNYRITTQREFS